MSLGERNIDTPREILRGAQVASSISGRRYDIDWLRTLAMALLIVYHVAITFQPWAARIYFFQNDSPLEWLWIGMSLLNVWRIPILFLISGMAVRFAMERRSWQQLLADRTIRILVPFVFGFFAVCPILGYLLLSYYHLDVSYSPNAGHLWFLANIFVYVLTLLPLLIYVKSRGDGALMRRVTWLRRYPWLLFAAALPLMAEAALVNPENFVLYAGTWHGFWMGLLCFLAGFMFVSLKDVFWSVVRQMRWPAALLAFLLYLARVLVFGMESVPNYVTALESTCWMLSILGFGSVLLNRPSRSLSYFSKAVYPVYIVHLPVQFAISYHLIPMKLPASLKFGLLLVGTFGISLLIYEYVLRRIKWIRPMFGIALNATQT